MSLSHHCGGILAHSSLQNCFNSATLEGFWAWMDCLWSCHAATASQSDLSLDFDLVFLEPFRGGLAGVLEIIVLLHNPTALELEGTNWRPDILLQDFLIECRIHGSINFGKSSRSWSCKAAPDHHTTTTMFDCWYDVLMLCWFYARCNGTQTFQKVKLLSHQSTEYLPKSLGDNQDIFWQMWDEPLCYFWSAVAFALGLSHGCCFCPVSFLLLNHEHWP